MIPSTITNTNHNDKGLSNNSSFSTSSSSALASTSASTSTSTQPSCPACHSLSLQFTPSISATVCTTCGNIIDEDTLCTQDVHIDDKGRECRERIGSEFQKVRQWGREKWVGFCMREIKRFLTLLCNSLNLSQVVKSQAFELFKNAKRLNPKFQFGDRGKIMVAGCLYIVVRNDGKPVSLLEIANAIPTDPYILGTYVNRVISTLQLPNPPAKDVSLFIPRFLSLIRPYFPSLPEPQAALLSLTQSLTKRFVSADCSILTGRHVEPISLAVVLLSIESFRKEKISKEMVEKCCQECGLAVSTVLSRYRELIDRFKEGVKNLAWVRGVKRGKEYLWVKEVLEYWEGLEAETKGRSSLLEESRNSELQSQDGTELVDEGSGGEDLNINQVSSELSLHSFENASLSASTSSLPSLSSTSSPSTAVPLSTTQTNIDMPPAPPLSANSSAVSISLSQMTQSQRSIPPPPTTNSLHTNAAQVDLPPSYLRSLQSRYRRHLRLSRAIRSLQPHLSPPCLIIPPFHGAAKSDNTKGEKGYVQARFIVGGGRSTGWVKDQTTTKSDSGEATKEGKKESELPFTDEDMILERLLLAGYTYADLIEKTEKELTRISFELDGFSSGLSSSSTSGGVAQSQASSSSSLKSLKRPRYHSSKLSRDFNLDSTELSSLDLSAAEENEYILDTKEVETKRFFKRLKLAGVADEDDDRFEDNEDGNDLSHEDISLNSDGIERKRVEGTEAIEDDDQDDGEEEETAEDDDAAGEYDG